MNKELEIRGFEECPAWLKTKYCEAVNYKCQICKNKGRLEIHRLKRGNKNGLYTLVPLNHKLNNVKVVCSDCHKKLHGNEFSNVRGK